MVAYKQPVTRSRISAIRGVNCDGVIRTLTSRGLVEECGTEPESGAFLYRTTTLFLEKLGLDNVGQLPPLAPFLPDDIDEVADAVALSDSRRSSPGRRRLAAGVRGPHLPRTGESGRQGRPTG